MPLLRRKISGLISRRFAPAQRAEDSLLSSGFRDMAVSHGARTELTPSKLTFQTPAPEWSYALVFPLSTIKERLVLGPDETLAIDIELAVTSGSIGVGVVAANQVSYRFELRKDSGEPSDQMRIRIEEPEKSAFLIFRNLSTSGRSSAELLKISASGVPRIDHQSDFLEAPFEILSDKWSTVPFGVGIGDRVSSVDALRLPDGEFLEWWQGIRRRGTEAAAFQGREWHHHLYRDAFRGKRILDVGSGTGIDASAFLEAGARVTCADVVQSNLDVIRRATGALGLREVDFLWIENLQSLDALRGDYDVIWCNGSMIHAPFDLIKQESAILLRHLPVGGRWIELCYPKERWVAQGERPFHLWGQVTDGPGTPWAEWYDLDKLLARLEPATFKTILAFNYHRNQLNWFDLLRST